MTKSKKKNGGGRILLAHGGGGSLMRSLLEDVILPEIGNPLLNRLEDSALLPSASGRLAFTTDGYVVRPLFFPGGDIGRLAVCGTVNDLAVAGARPLWMSLALLIEEGFPVDDLRRILRSVKDVCEEVGMEVATGDVKVLNRGALDGLSIVTTAVGSLPEGLELSPARVRPGARILINGPVAQHGAAIMASREELSLEAPLESDVAPLWGLVSHLGPLLAGVRCARDPTRGGVAALLNEIAQAASASIRIRERAFPLDPAVKGVCDLIGLEPLEVANEGKIVLFCEPESADALLIRMREHPLGRRAALVGEVTEGPAGDVVLETSAGGERLLAMPYGEALPRIC